MIGIPLLVNCKADNYDVILVIVNRLTKMVYYKSIKIIIDVASLVEVIINVVVRYHSLSESIISNFGSLLTSKFWSLLCYFLGIK